MGAIPTKNVPGDVSVGRNVRTGGDVTVAGHATVNRDLRVKGWLYAQNIKGAEKGLFPDAATLRRIYPTPRAGDWAMVGNGFPAKVFVESGGKWVDTDKSVSGPAVSFDTFNEEIAELEDGLERAKPRYVKFTELDTMGLGSTQAVSLVAWEPHTRYTVIDGDPLTGEDGVTMVNVLGMLDIFKTYDSCVVTQVFTTNAQLDVETGKIGPDHLRTRLFRYVRFMPTTGENAYKWGAWEYDDATLARNVFDHWLVPVGPNHMNHERYGVMVAPMTEEDALEPDDMPAFELWGANAFLRLTFRTSGGGTRLHIPLPEPTFPVEYDAPDKAGIFGKTAFAKTVAAAVHQALIADAAKIGATHDSATKRFSLNGLTNITDDQMRAILLFGILPPFTTYGLGDRDKSPAIRTNVLQYDGGDALRNSATMNHAFYNQTSLEVAVVSPSRTGDQTYTLSPTSIGGAFNNCTALKRILGIINLDRIADANEGWGNNCSLLEEVHLHRLKKSLNLLNLPALTAESVRELVDYAANTEAITVSVHPTVLQKLSGLYDWGKVIGGNTEKVKWMAIMAAAAERNISFATT